MASEPIQLCPDECRVRQQRVREMLAASSVDRAVFVSHENVQYLTGFRPHRLMQAAVCLTTDGDCVLSAPNSIPDDVAADRVVTFEAQWLATLRQEQADAALTALASEVGEDSQGRTGVEFSVCGQHLRELTGDIGLDQLVDIDAGMWNLRRRKHPDELAMIRRAIACTEAMYATAREIIRPGITELDVFNQLHAAAVDVAGEPLTALGNDYQCNSPGGTPRERAAQDGELFILDLGPAYRGYYADNCRAIAVNQHPTDEQMRAWTAIAAVLDMVEQTVRPGVSCRELFARAKAMLDEYQPDAFCHHLGHGFGLFPHEAPHLNPNWDDVFEVGDVFTAEPGLYTDELRAGIRLEQNYRVTESGVELLTTFPLHL
jgi:Xaa-Pro aminopeptidase